MQDSLHEFPHAHHLQQLPASLNNVHLSLNAQIEGCADGGSRGRTSALVGDEGIVAEIEEAEARGMGARLVDEREGPVIREHVVGEVELLRCKALRKRRGQGDRTFVLNVVARKGEAPHGARRQGRRDRDDARICEFVPPQMDQL